MPLVWRPADAKRCPNCGLWRGKHHFPGPVEDEPRDEFAKWCLPCLRAEAERLNGTATAERDS